MKVTFRTSVVEDLILTTFISAQLRDFNTLEVVIEDLPEEVQFESTIEPDNDNDTNNNITISLKASSH
jgi:hypothetical protein